MSLCGEYPFNHCKIVKKEALSSKCPHGTLLLDAFLSTSKVLRKTGYGKYGKTREN